MSAPPVVLFQRTFNELSSSNLQPVVALYAKDIEFVDPLHAIHGLPNLQKYFAGLYDGVVACSFDFHSVLEGEGEAMLTWTMHLEHGRFCRGQVLHLPGASHVKFADKIHYHRDYFDAGALLYERVPVLGSAVRFIKSRL